MPMTQLDLEGALSLYDRGRWRAALKALDAADVSHGSNPTALALWIQCKGSLSERDGLESAFVRLLSMPEATLDDVRRGYGALGLGGHESFAPRLLAWFDERGLSERERTEMLPLVPPAFWPAEHLFAQIESTTYTYRYDELLEHARRRFAGDPRLAQVKPRPLDPAEQRRLEAEAARQQAERAKAERVAARQELSGKILREPTLEAAILAAPEDVEAHEVYGDWLQQHGDPRGELVALQAQRWRRPDDDNLAAAERALLQKLEPALLANLEELAVCAPTFRLGFLRALRLGCADDMEFEDALALLFRLDERRFLQELTIGAVVLDDELDFGSTMATIAEHARDLPSLRSLFIGDFTYEECELSWSQLGDASPLYSAFPELRGLKLRAGGMTLGDIVMPKLESFAIETGGLSRDSFNAVLGAQWPCLRSLSLWFGQEDYGGECTVEDVERLLVRQDLNLRHLGLANAAFTDELCPLLVASPLLPGLESLDLSKGCLTAAGARVLAEHQDRMRHLKRIDLSQNCLADGDLTLVSGLCAQVDVQDQDPERAQEDYHYSAVGE